MSCSCALFHYYHCTFGSTERKKVFELNNQFVQFLTKFKANPETCSLYTAILKSKLKTENAADKQELEAIVQKKLR
ncbi:MAG TPA: hypothetical protein VN698_05715 [Bacteroidia bacterium]|nr:hypothetical protein [Bacteroidia bacterium]